MKKLMILGGSRYAIPVINKAHELGCYVITCDYLPDNIAHKFSDEYCNVSIVDKDAVLNAARRLEIDGITSFACDPGVVTASYVADKMNLPTCGPYESVCILQNKNLFRRFLSENGFNVPKSKAFKDYSEIGNEIADMYFPIIVKPTDSAGSKGVTRLDDLSKLKDAFDHALSFSRSREVIIEEFITQKGYSSDSDSFSVDGRMELTSFSSQRFDKKADNPYVPAAFSWPSSISNDNQEILKKEIQRLITLLGMQTSIYNIETRESVDGIPYIMECSPRGGGNRLAECLEYATGLKLIENVVRASMGMPLVKMEYKQSSGYIAEVIIHSIRSGIFDSLWISDSIKQFVIEEDLWVTAGDTIGSFSAANESLGTIIFRFDDESVMREVLDNIDEYIKVVLKTENR